jgi:hypothetical protein
MTRDQAHLRTILKADVKIYAEAVTCRAAVCGAEELPDDGSFRNWVRAIESLVAFDKTHKIEPSGT